MLDHDDVHKGALTAANSVFGRQIRFDLAQGLQLITTNGVHFNSVSVGLLSVGDWLKWI